MSLTDYVKSHVAALIATVSREAQRARQDASDEAVHDLRVAIRRLSETLRVFAEVFPHGHAKLVRKDLREAMSLAGEARNHDIAEALMRKARVPMMPIMAERRARAVLELSSVLARWTERGIDSDWRKQLHV